MKSSISYYAGRAMVVSIEAFPTEQQKSPSLQNVYSPSHKLASKFSLILPISICDHMDDKTSNPLQLEKLWFTIPHEMNMIFVHFRIL